MSWVTVRIIVALREENSHSLLRYSYVEHANTTGPGEKRGAMLARGVRVSACKSYTLSLWFIFTTHARGAAHIIPILYPFHMSTLSYHISFPLLSRKREAPSCTKHARARTRLDLARANETEN